MRNYKRKKIWIHRSQTHLFIGICLYTAVYQVVAVAIVVGSQKATSVFESVLGGKAPFFEYVFAPIALACLALVFIYDSIRFVHRIVGPAYRFQQTLRSVLDGQEVRLIKLREGDYLTELKDDMNEMLVLLHERGVIEIKNLPPVNKPKQPAVEPKVPEHEFAAH